MQFSHSRVDCFKHCPYQFKLRYIDNLKTLDEFEPADALRLGTALHTGIQESVDKAITDYYMSYPVITDAHINEAIKLDVMIKKARDILPLADAQFEVELNCDTFKGFIDMLVKNEDGTYDIYDFKYSNNIDKYMESPQLAIYRYYAETLLNIKVSHLYFVFVEKVNIRQKKTEDLFQFRQRLKTVLQDAKVTIQEVQYKPSKVIDFMNNQVEILQCTDYEKKQSKLCDWCEYQSYCEKKEELDMLPSTKRVEIEKNSYKKLWIYGSPFSGKTTFADQSPTPLNLNTDGNVKYVTMPRLAIKDEVTVEGRLTKRKFAWEIFKDAVADLEKGSEFETIVVDLLEDTYEHCRLYMYEQLDISHESDDSFRAWDKVRTEYLSTIKRLLNLDYNVILISHEDTSKDLTKKGGDKVTAISPNLNEKASKKIAGMVDLVARLVVDGEKRTLNFKSDEVVFGGGRLKDVKTTEIPLNWDALCDVYDEAIGKTKTAHQKKVEQYVATQKVEAEPTPESQTEPVTEPVTEPEPQAEVVKEDVTYVKVADAVEEEPQQPARRTRRVRN